MHLFLLVSKDSLLRDIEPNLIQVAKRISVVLLDTDTLTLEALKSAKLPEDPRCDFSKLDRLPTSLSFCKTLVDRADDWCVVGMGESPRRVPRHGRHISYVFGLWDDPSNMPSFMKDFMQITKFKCPEFYQELFDSSSIADAIGNDTFREIEDLVPSRRVCIADITRYYLMLSQGGLYLDLDVRVKDDLGPLIDKCLTEGVQVVLFTEHDNCDPKSMGKRENKEYTRRIYNCMFWSVPKHPPMGGVRQTRTGTVRGSEKLGGMGKRRRAVGERSGRDHDRFHGAVRRGSQRARPEQQGDLRAVASHLSRHLETEGGSQKAPPRGF